MQEFRNFAFNIASAGLGTGHERSNLYNGLSLKDFLGLRRKVPIADCGEGLIPIDPMAVSLISPHPYQAKGAQYGKYGPFYLRETVCRQLLLAARLLETRLPSYRLLIFDAYRPIEVQAYMIELTFAEMVRKIDLNPADLTAVQREDIMAEVEKVWAPPSKWPLLPPPHSTGAAVDLTIVDAAGNLLPMGGNFDEPMERSHSNYYDDKTDPEGYGENRRILKRVMSDAGFTQLPWEWWHYDFKDQVAVLLSSFDGSPDEFAQYGRFN